MEFQLHPEISLKTKVKGSIFESRIDTFDDGGVKVVYLYRHMTSKSRSKVNLILTKTDREKGAESALF